MTTSVAITAPVSDAGGASATGNATAFATPADTVTVNSVTVAPATAVAGTTRTITVVATSSVGGALTYGTPTGTGLTFTSTGTPGQWTFVY